MSQTQAAFTYFNRAASFYHRACYAQAVKYYLTGLEIDPTCVEAYADLAKAYEMLGCWDQAVESLETALRLRPDYPTALRRKQRILEEKNVYDSLTDELNLTLDTNNQHQLTNAVQVGHARNGDDNPKIDHKFFTLTCECTIPQKLLSVLSQLVEHAYHKVGGVFQCYPQHKVPIFIEAVNQAEASLDSKSPIVAMAHTLSSGASLPQWAVACYEKGSIRLTYRPYSDSSIGVLYAVVRHEWTHLLIDLIAQGHCPKWLDEGLAQFMGRPLMHSEKIYLQQASRDRHLLPLHILRKPFQVLPEQQRRLAYLQSYAITKFLIQQFGVSALCDVLKRLGDGKSIDAAFQEVFGQTEAGVVALNEENCLTI